MFTHCFKYANRILTVEVRTASESDEKLRTIGVWTLVGHAKKGR